MMRKLALTAAAAASILVGGSLVAGPAGAMTISPAGVRDAADALSTVEKTSCWRYGFFGWGWYPCGYYYGYGPGYGYYGPGYFRFGFFGHRGFYGRRYGYGYGGRGFGRRHY